MSLSVWKFYIDWGDKWLRSFDDKVVPLAGRRNWSVVVFNCPLFIAFLTASVNDENEATVWIGLLSVLLFIVGPSESVDDCDVGQNNADDEDVFPWSDKCFIWDNGVQCCGSSVDGWDTKIIRKFYY